MKGVWVAIPAYSSSISVQTANALNVEMIKFFDTDTPMAVVFHAGNAIITRCRNCMVMDFLASNPESFTDMLFLDDDVAFEPGAIRRLLDHPVDIVGGAYPYRRDPIGFPIKLNDSNIQDRDEKTGLMKVAGLPAGFLKISRHALETIMARFPDHWHHEHTVAQGKAWRFFEFIVRDHKLYGEDFAFCALAREAGFDIWCDPDITLNHVGPKVFTGNLQQTINEKYGDPKDPLAALHQFNQRSAA